MEGVNGIDLDGNWDWEGELGSDARILSFPLPPFSPIQQTNTGSLQIVFKYRNRTQAFLPEPAIAIFFIKGSVSWDF